MIGSCSRLWYEIRMTWGFSWDAWPCVRQSNPGEILVRLVMERPEAIPGTGAFQAVRSLISHIREKLYCRASPDFHRTHGSSPILLVSHQGLRLMEYFRDVVRWEVGRAFDTGNACFFGDPLRESVDLWTVSIPQMPGLSLAFSAK